MDIEQILKQLKQSEVAEDQGRLLLNLSTIKTVNAHEIVYKIGQKDDLAFFVLKGGFVNQFVNLYTGDEITTSFHLHNFQSFMTVLEPYFTGESSTYQLKAIKKSEILIFSRKDIECIAKNNVQFKDTIVKKLIQVLISVNDLKTRLIALKSEEVYNYLITSKREIIKEVPSKYIAEFMGISREHLSRLKNK